MLYIWVVRDARGLKASRSTHFMICSNLVLAELVSLRTAHDTHHHTDKRHELQSYVGIIACSMQL